MSMRHGSARSGACCCISVKPVGNLDPEPRLVQRQIDAGALAPLAVHHGAVHDRRVRDFVRPERAGRGALSSRRTTCGAAIFQLRHHAIGRRARAARSSIRRRSCGVFLDHAAQLGEVEVRVHRLHRIERPLDQVVALRQRALALRQLEPVAQAAAILGQHAGHVRPQHRLARPSCRRPRRRSRPSGPARRTRRAGSRRDAR